MTRWLCSAIVLGVFAALPAAGADIARYILPPGNFGGLPITANSTDQLPLYSGLSALRDNITQSDIDAHYLPEDFTPIGATHEEVTGRTGLHLIYDSWGIPHIFGDTHEDVAFGAGWATARDRGLLLTFGRNPARIAVADVPNIDAFSLVTSPQPYTPSAQAEALVTAQVQLIQDTYKAKGRQIISEAQAYADGINAYWASVGNHSPPITVNDVVAVTAFIGSIFGAGGGGEAANSDLLAKLQAQLGSNTGYKAWSDVMLADDPEAPTTISRRFNYPPLTGGPVTGSVTLDPASVQSIDPRTPPSMAMLAPPRRRASNFLVTSPTRSADANTLAVMGPQLGYFYPEIVEQMDLHGPDYTAQGAAVPGLSMYILIGRTENYAWSLTSSGQDVRDVFVEQLCETDSSAPTRASTHYMFNGQCKAMDSFNAGTLGTTPLIYNVTVHGPVFATATVGGKPVALSRRRSTFGRDGLNLAALKDMTEGKASTPGRFYRAANEFGFTFNWAYASRKATAYFASGYLPKRARGLDRRLPTLGTGQYEWKGFLRQSKHPHDVTGPDGLLLNWNNRSAPGFMHGDDEPYGSVHRVELFNNWPASPHITDNVGIMNRAATGDVRQPVWPVVSRVLHMGTAPSPRDLQIVNMLDDWVGRAAPRLDADDDGFYDEPAPGIMDAVWKPIASAVMSTVFSGTVASSAYGSLLDNLDNVRSLGGLEGESYVDKDLRTLLGDPVTGPFNLKYCGSGVLSACEASLWQAIHQAADAMATAQGQADPTLWRTPGARTSFVPGILSITFPFTNRPTFQQVLEFDHSGS